MYSYIWDSLYKNESFEIKTTVYCIQSYIFITLFKIITYV